jgi:hypothetical protein
MLFIEVRSEFDQVPFFLVLVWDGGGSGGEGRAGAGWPDGGEPRVGERVAHTTQKQWGHSAEHFLSCAPPKAQRSEVKGYATLGSQLSGRNLFIECYL